MNIAVLMACHNRKEKTLSCLRSVFGSDIPEHVSLSVFLTDDGSTDGTSNAVMQFFPQVTILLGNGDLFWNRGMHLAFGEALRIGFDGYIWINDDTELYPSFLNSLLKTYSDSPPECSEGVIVVGSTKSAQTGQRTYGGINWRGSLINTMSPIEPGSLPIECNAMNGNIVFISSKAAGNVGNLDSKFRHAMGDIDYALRARAFGVKIFVAPGYLGVCENNPIEGTYFDRALPKQIRFRKIFSPTGLPMGSWFLFTKRHCGPFWLLNMVWPYFKLLIR